MTKRHELKSSGTTELGVETCLYFSETKPGCTLWIKDGCPCARFLDNCDENAIRDRSRTVAILNVARGIFQQNHRRVA